MEGDEHEMASSLEKELNVIVNDMNKEITEAINKYQKERIMEFKESFENIKDSVIREWYGSYEQKQYKRKESLYAIPRFEFDEKTNMGRITYSPSYMTEIHRVSNEYIFENSFVYGFHGGADDFKGDPKPFYEAPHPDPGTPYWRKPMKGPWPPKDGDPLTDNYPYKYRYWYDTPAPQSDSPLLSIDAKFREVVAKKTKRHAEVIKKMRDNIVKKYVPKI